MHIETVFVAVFRVPVMTWPGGQSALLVWCKTTVSTWSVSMYRCESVWSSWEVSELLLCDRRKQKSSIKACACTGTVKAAFTVRAWPRRFTKFHCRTHVEFTSLCQERFILIILADTIPALNAALISTFLPTYNDASTGMSIDRDPATVGNGLRSNQKSLLVQLQQS